MGFKGNLGRWLGSFLKGRLQAVRVGAGLSSWAPVISGVPQGSVLGPLLFLIFISDLGGGLPTGSLSTVLKYVDDTKIFRGVSNLEDIEELQLDLNSLYDWQERSNMRWNGSKFVALQMGHSPSIWEDSQLFTPDWGEPIKQREVTRDLGITMESKGDF